MKNNLFDTIYHNLSVYISNREATETKGSNDKVNRFRNSLFQAAVLYTCA